MAIDTPPPNRKLAADRRALCLSRFFSGCFATCNKNRGLNVTRCDVTTKVSGTCAEAFAREEDNSPVLSQNRDSCALENEIFAKFAKRFLKESDKGANDTVEAFGAAKAEDDAKMGDYKVRASDQMSVERSVFTAVKLYADDDENDERPAKRDAASEQRRKVEEHKTRVEDKKLNWGPERKKAVAAVAGSGTTFMGRGSIDSIHQESSSCNRTAPEAENGQFHEGEDSLKQRSNKHARRQSFAFSAETDFGEVDAEPSIIITSGLFKNKRTYYTYCIVGILVLLHCVVLISILFPYPLHASCIVKWKFSEPCTHVTQKLRYQIMNWSSWNTCRQRDHNCLYTLKSSTEENVIRATHTTSNLKSHEKIRIVFQEMNNTCLATADSITNDWFTVFDYGANYCNLHNLVVGAGLDTKFLETTSDAICTQFSMAVCE
ncbi:hypothetical protein HN011_004624 [Eciton burchellii]|nr:hypothetical protein HN011_004624 [Eciton burchellii]